MGGGLTNLEIDEKEGYVLISVNPKIYPVDVVLSAAYLFTEKNYVLLDGDPKDEIVVEIRPKEKDDLKRIGMEFNNELIEYANYAVSTIKNEKLREAIIQRVMLTNSGEKISSPQEILKRWEDSENKDVRE